MNLNEIYIGDNLKIMNSKEFQKYKNKIKVIYIDPPYNTNSKFSYKDSMGNEAWIEFIFDRIKKSYDLLRENGCIFISIDDNQFAELKIICDKVFKKENFIGTFITHQAQRSNAKHINTVHEYVLCYAKNKKKLSSFKINRMNIPEDAEMIKSIYKEINLEFKNNGKEKASEKLAKLIKKYCEERDITWLKNYCNIDDEGKIYFAKDLSMPSEPHDLDIPEINLHLKKLKTRGWASKEKFIDLHNKNLLVFRNGRPYEKHYLENSDDNVPSILNFYSRQGTNNLKKLKLKDLFDTPKPVELIKFLIKISMDKDDIILDYFAGSGTTAQAVYEINKEDKKDLKYILIQLDEKMNKDSKPYKIAKSLGIDPVISEAMLYRIKTFCSLNKIDGNYVIFSGKEDLNE